MVEWLGGERGLTNGGVAGKGAVGPVQSTSIAHRECSQSNKDEHSGIN